MSASMHSLPHRLEALAGRNVAGAAGYGAIRGAPAAPATPNRPG